MIRRPLAALLSAAIVLYSFPVNSIAAEIEAPLSPRTPGGTPIVMAPQIPGTQGIPALPVSPIADLSVKGADVASALPTQNALSAGAAARAEGALAGAEAASARAEGGLTAAEAALAKAEGLPVAQLPAVSGKAVAQSTGKVAAGATLRQSVGSRIASGLRSLRFWNKTISEDSIAAAETSNTAPLARSTPQSKDEKVVPAPQQPGDNDGGKKGGRSWFGLGGAAASFIGALLVAQVGVEALGASMPTLIQKVFGDFTAVAQLAIFSSIASIVGRQMAPVFIQKYGLKKVYIAAEAARVFSIGAMVAMLIFSASNPASFIAHNMLSMMMVSYSINGALGGVAVTAESSIPPAIVGQDNDKLERFWSVEQTLLETIGVSGPILTGIVVSHFGFVPALVAYPVFLALSIVVLLMTLRIPKKVEALRLADLERAKADGGKSMGFGAIFKDFFARIVRGTKLVWHTPALKYAFLAYTAYMALNPFLYSMIAPAYALRLVGDPQLATGIGGWLTGLYSAGGLLGGVLMMFEQKKLDKAEKAGTMSPEQKSEYMRKSLLKWLRWGTVGLLAIGTLAFKSPMFLGGLTIPALALIPFGVAQVISVVKLKSYFQSKAPQKEMADAMGFHGAASLAVSTAGLLALKYLFKGAAGFTPFWYIAAAMIPLALYYVWLTSRMAKVSKPDEKK